MKANDIGCVYNFCRIQAPAGHLYIAYVEDEIRKCMKPGTFYTMAYSARIGDCGKRVTVKRKIQMVEDCGSFILFRNSKGFNTCILYQDIYQMILKKQFFPSTVALPF